MAAALNRSASGRNWMNCDDELWLSLRYWIHNVNAYKYARLALATCTSLSACLLTMRFRLVVLFFSVYFWPIYFSACGKTTRAVNQIELMISFSSISYIQKLNTFKNYCSWCIFDIFVASVIKHDTFEWNNVLPLNYWNFFFSKFHFFSVLLDA